MARPFRIKARRFLFLPVENPPMETEEEIDLDADSTTLIAMHCWDIGCEGGPALHPKYAVGMGLPENIRLSEEIMKNKILPLVEAARRARVLVSHVESAGIGLKHPELMREVPPTLPDMATARPDPAVPGHAEAYLAAVHGAGYNTDPESPYVRRDRVKYLMPKGDEPFAVQSAQLDQMLRRRGIENLIYTGFATNMCVIQSPGGIRDMSLLGYCIFLVREATLGLEYPDTLADRTVTRLAIRYVEHVYGHSVTYSDLMASLNQIAH